MIYWERILALASETVLVYEINICFDFSLFFGCWDRCCEEFCFVCLRRKMVAYPLTRKTLHGNHSI